MMCPMGSRWLPPRPLQEASCQNANEEGQGSDQEAEVPPYARFNRTRCRGGALGHHRFGSTLEKSTKELGIGPGATGFIEALQVCFRGTQAPGNLEGSGGVKFGPEAGQEFDTRCVGR